MSTADEPGPVEPDDGPDVVLTPDPESATKGGGIVRATVIGTLVFLVVGVLGVVAPSAFTVPFIVVSLGEFFVGSVVFVLAFLRAVDRSRTETIGIGGLFFGIGSTPGRLQRLLVGSLLVQVVASIVFASVRVYTAMAFGILAPMWALAFTGLWAAAYGTFPAREPEPTRTGLRDAERRAHRRGGTDSRRDRTE